MKPFVPFLIVLLPASTSFVGALFFINGLKNFSALVFINNQDLVAEFTWSIPTSEPYRSVDFSG